MKVSGMSKRGGGARTRPVAERFNFNIVKREHHSLPYEDCWHEYLAFDGDRVVGRVASFEIPLGSKDCWINDLWVEREHRRKGIGRELLKKTMENAQAHDYRRIMGELVPYDNAPMRTVRQFYGALGFDMVDNWEDTQRSVAMLRLEPARAALPRAG